MTGTTGQIGRAVAKSAPDAVDVIATNRAELDLADCDSIRSAVRQHSPDLIINTAAYTAVDNAESDREQAQLINERGPQCLASCARVIGARMIHLSTDFVFDGRARSPYSPTATPNPLCVYGTTKLHGEQVVFSQLGDSATVLRTAWVYSAGGKNFLLSILRQLRERGSVSVVNDQLGTPTAADSVAEIVWALASNPGSQGLYHWTDAGKASWYDFACAIAETASALGLIDRGAAVVPITSAEFTTPATRPKYCLLDTSSTTAITGIVARDWRVRLKGVLGELAIG